MQAKLKSRAEIATLIGAYPRARKVVMAHGVFDVVHYGHIRHLAYAKGKADILVASVTADRHVDKGKHRPHVPQELRALNVAALEMVDYVLIDDEPTPLETIRALQPDYFAKGYEYRDMGNPKTVEETKTLTAYGGQIIFTPGDVVYSSTHLLELARPRLGLEKLARLMERSRISFGGLREAVEKMRGRHIHVVGDTIVDRITRTSVIGAHAKTPTVSVLYEGSEDYAGGAAVVAEHLVAAGAEVELSTVLGADDAGLFAERALVKAGVTVRAVIDRLRPTTLKEVIAADGYRLLKVDRVDNRPISEPALARLAADLRSSDAEAVVFSDFRHGIFNRGTIPALCAAIRAPYRAADSQVASRWGNITDFGGFDLLAPNEREARFALGDQDSGIGALAGELRKAARCATLILKLGEHGVIAIGQETAVLDSFCERLVDPVGAGDALLAYATLAMLVTGDPAAAAILGSVAAALECEAEGNVPVTQEAVLERLARLEEGVSYGSRH